MNKKKIKSSVKVLCWRANQSGRWKRPLLQPNDALSLCQTSAVHNLAQAGNSFYLYLKDQDTKGGT